MIVKQIITTTKDIELHIIGATLLSIEEAEHLLTKEERKYRTWWWLRSPGFFQDYVALVDYDGSVSYSGLPVSYVSGCVRPALKIKNHNLKIGDKFMFGDKDFKVISNDLAFCLEDIGHHCFRKDGEADDANNYEKSNVKKYVDKWFEEAVKNDGD